MYKRIYTKAVHGEKLTDRSLKGFRYIYYYYQEREAKVKKGNLTAGKIGHKSLTITRALKQVPKHVGLLYAIFFIVCCKNWVHCFEYFL